MSGFLDEASIAELRALSEAGMTARCEVRRVPARVEDDAGRPTSGTAPVPVEGLEEVPCSFTPAATGKEAVVADAPAAFGAYTVRFPYGTPVGVADVLVITHEIEGVPSPLTLHVISLARKTTEISRTVVAQIAAEPG